MNNAKMNKVIKMWDKRADQYDERAINGEVNYQTIVKYTERQLNQSDRVFEFGCGTAIITNQIAASVKEIDAIDISSEMIRVAKRKAEEGNIENVHFAQSSLFDEKHQKESFDVVLGFYILHLMDDPLLTSQRVNELLKPGGLFVSATPCMGEKGRLLKIFMPPILKLVTLGKLAVKMYEFSELEELMLDANFQIEETKSFSKYPHYFIVAKKR